MNNTKQLVEAFLEKHADRRSKWQSSSGCEFQDQANSRLLRIGFEDGARSLAPLLLKAMAALDFYAGKTKDAEWDGPRLMVMDKFGGLDDEASGPYIAEEALAEIRQELEGK